MKNWTLALTGRALLATVFASLSAVAAAQMTPVGQWHSSDEKTGELKSLIIISETGGVLNGHVDKLLRKTADQKAVCKECTDDRKDKPMLGLQIIRGAKKVDGKDVWEGGKILDPENGKEYTLRMTPIEDGKKLEVRGSILFVGRTQTWVRVQ
ncbi:MAG TPA: DUF2147 domain-containing protein [Rhodoferax sp.]|mgnify:FL=1|nr:DUF2147 domain-containing protein [Rhodoferax sp.]